MSLFRGVKTHSGKISVVAQIRAKSGHEDEVRCMFESLVGPSRKEPGCTHYSLYEDINYTGSFFTYEEWESEAALTTHLALHKDELDKAKGLLDEELRIDLLKLVE